MKKIVVNASWGNPDEYDEARFDTIKEAKAYCKEHGLPFDAIKAENVAYAKGLLDAQRNRLITEQITKQ